MFSINYDFEIDKKVKMETDILLSKLSLTKDQLAVYLTKDILKNAVNDARLKDASIYFSLPYQLGLYWFSFRKFIFLNLSLFQAEIDVLKNIDTSFSFFEKEKFFNEKYSLFANLVEESVLFNDSIQETMILAHLYLTRKSIFSNIDYTYAKLLQQEVKHIPFVVLPTDNMFFSTILNDGFNYHKIFLLPLLDGDDEDTCNFFVKNYEVLINTVGFQLSLSKYK